MTVTPTQACNVLFNKSLIGNNIKLSKQLKASNKEEVMGYSMYSM